MNPQNTKVAPGKIQITAPLNHIKELQKTVEEISTFLGLNIPIEEGGATKIISIAYLGQEVNLNSYLPHELENAFNLLNRINPKNGKFCSCSDCKICPSKRKSFKEFLDFQTD